MDVIADLALPVPATVICEMLGVPYADHDRFTTWTAEATRGLAVATAPPEILARTRAATDALVGYFERLIAERRGALGDDLLSELIRAEEAGDRLSPTELVSQRIGLLIAGFETTIGLIGNGVRALIRHPAEIQKLKADPTLIASAVEECLRYDGPIPMTFRVTHADVTFGEHLIPRDAVVAALLGAANHDPARFPDPERFDVTRNDDGHLAFGGATHFCLGAHLARTEARAAIGALVARFDDLRLVSESVEWGPSLFRVPGRMPITFRAAR
jgi:cytochrome P450